MTTVSNYCKLLFMVTDIAHNGRRGWSRNEVAELLDVTPARVSQIAKELGVRLRWHYRDGFSYTVSDVSRMKSRSRKPGPKATGGVRKR